MGIDGGLKQAVLRLGGGIVKTTKISKKKAIKDGSAYKPVKITASNDPEAYSIAHQISLAISPGNKLKSFEFPNDVSVLCFDATTKLKNYTNPNITKGRQYVLDHVLAEVAAFLTLDHAEAAILCLDRGSPPNKDMEHEKRYKDTQLLDINAISDNQVLISDNIIPDPSAWEGFTNHPKLKQELLYYVTQTILEPPVIKSTFQDFYTPPPGKCLFLFGGTTEKPLSDRGRRGPFRPDSNLYYVANESCVNYRDEDGQQIPISTEFKRRHGIYTHETSGYSPEAQTNLLEGEMAAMYFSKPYTLVEKNVLIMTVDGDVLIQALMACKDRIDPTTGNFKNKVYVRLIIPSSGGKEYTDIDMNRMYFNLVKNPLFARAGISDPALPIAVASCLLKNDFFHGFAYGMDSVNADTDESCPFVLYTLLTYLNKFGNTLVLMDETKETSSDVLSQLVTSFPHVHLRVDEDVFVDFVEHLYVVKWLPSAKKKLIKVKKTTETLPAPFDFTPHPIHSSDVELVKRYLDGLSVAKKRIPKREEIRVFARMLEWTLTYFYNGYRGLCIIPDPLFKVDGLPYYGWEISASEISTDAYKCVCRQSSAVSAAEIPDTDKYTSIRGEIQNNLWKANTVTLSLTEGKAQATQREQDKKRKREELAQVEKSAEAMFDEHDTFLLSEELEVRHKKRRIIRADAVIPILSHSLEPGQSMPWTTARISSFLPVAPTEKQSITRFHFNSKGKTFKKSQ